MGMKTIILFLRALLLIACTTPPSTETNTTSPSNHTNDTIQEHTTQNNPTPQRDKRLEALGFGIFDYSTLTSKNCDDTMTSHQQNVINIQNDIKKAEKDVEEEQEDVDELEQLIATEQEKGNTVEDLLEDLDEEQEELHDTGKELEQLQKLIKKYLIIKDEIKKQCLLLRAKDKP